MTEGREVVEGREVTEAAKGAARGPSTAYAALAACLGSLVEWYDFYVYSYTAIYFSRSFFPAGNQTTQLLDTAGVLAIGYLAKPLGGWLLGRVADTRGRRTSMIASMVMMSAGSLLVAALPTHATIGILAPVGLVAARMLQGLAIGAEYGIGATYLSEIAPGGRRALVSSFQYVTIIAGQLAGLLVVLASQRLLSPAATHAWGWRVPFAVGACGALTVSYLRRAMMETAKAADMRRAGAGSLRALLRHRRALLFVLAFTVASSLYYNTFTAYMQKFLVNSAGLAPEKVDVVMTLAIVVFMVAQPAFGLLCERIGIRASMLLFTGLATVLSVPLLRGLEAAHDPLGAFRLVVVGLLVLAFYTPISGLLKADLFPPEIRATGVGFPYAVANALVGGTAEYVALWLRSAGVETYFFSYVALLSAIGFVAALLLPDLRRHGYLDGRGDIEGPIGGEAAGRGRRARDAS